MIETIVIGLTTNVIDALISNQIRYSKAKERIYQHRILISDSLLKIYREYFGKTGDEYLFDQWFKQLNAEDKVNYADSISDDLYDELKLQIKKFKHNIIICDNDILSEENGIILIKLIDVDSQNDENELAKYCIPMHSIIRKKSDSSEFAVWLKNVLAGEKNITIIDHFILKPDNDNILRDFYIPAIPSDARIDLYFGADYEYQRVISALKSKFGNRIHMHSSEPEDFHDRYILCNSYMITIGVGLDVFLQATGQARKESFYSLSNGERPTLPSRPRKNYPKK